VIMGVNKVHPHDGKEYHVQAEDLGVESACFEVRVYLKGTILWHKQIRYDEVLTQKLGRAEQDEAIRGLMEKTIHTVQAAISKGKIG
jgi:hypothetical protein